MQPEETLKQKYRAVGRVSGKELLLQRRDALSFIADCARLGVTILGIEFFAEAGQNVVPVAVADYSALLGEPDAPQRSIVAARNLITSRFPDTAKWVTFVLAEEVSSSINER